MSRRSTIEPPEPASSNPTLTIATMCLSVVLVIAGVAGLTVAIPTIGQELQASQSELQWIIDSYAIVLAALLLPAGALGDKFGRKKLMMIGWAILVVSSLATSLSNDIWTIVALRGVSGVGAALIFPGTLSTITNVIPAEKKTQAIAAWTVSASIGGTIGSVGAGALIEAFWFGSIFVGTAIVAAAIAAMTLVFVPETSDPSESNLDPVGSLASLVGIGAITLGIIEGPLKGWTDPLVLGGLAVGIVGIVGFVVWELHTDKPLLDVRLFKLAGFSTGSVSIFLQFIAAFGFFFTASQFLAFVFDYSPLLIGLGLLPLGVTIPLASGLAPKLIGTFGRGPVGGAGLAILGAGAAMFSFVGVDSSYWLFAIAVLVFGFGFGLAAPPATEAIVEALPANKQGVASAMNDVTRELGGALGIAVVGSFLTVGYRNSVESSDALPAALVEPISDSAGAGLAIAGETAASGDQQLAGSIVDTVRLGIADGFAQAMLVAAGVAVVGAIYVAIRTPKAISSTTDATADETTLATPLD
ncbi:MFS transporter [Ilumatobacter sp.]|uniref:MFS transporter n=1 Tax=Ilumatobacter sp. TaxID=1967498 RepID=UPI0037503713